MLACLNVLLLIYKYVEHCFQVKKIAKLNTALTPCSTGNKDIHILNGTGNFWNIMRISRSQSFEKKLPK